MNQSVSTSAGAYVPGVCNINHQEITYRKKAGYFGLGIFMLVAAVTLVLPINRWFRVVLFLPAFIAAIGFLQAKYKFCVAYGAGGKQNATDGDTVAQEIVDAAALKLDKQRARKINTQAAVLAVVVTALMVLIP